MRTFLFTAFLTVAMALTISTARAELIFDRITVAVHGQGPDVVLIPGLTSSGAVWDATVAHLVGNYRLHVVQIDGFAGAHAKANAQGPVVQPSLDALDAYIKSNHLGAVKMIGHSLGGTMGLMLASQHPEDVGRLMVVDALPFAGMLLGAYDVAGAKSAAAGMRDRILNESQEAYAQGEKSFVSTLVKSTEGRKLATAWAVASDKAVVAQAFYEDSTIDLRPKLQGIKTPVTVLYPWDSSSPYSQSDTDAFYQQNFAALPNKKMVRIDGAYHFIMLDQPETFLAQVDVFLK